MNTKHIITAALAIALASAASAQTFQTGYFLDNYTYSYQLNPASQPEYIKGFVGLGISNISVGANTNVGLDSFLFPVTVDGQKKVVTGLNENVDAATFLGGLGDPSKANVNASVNLISFGFYGKKNPKVFHSYELNVKANAATAIPRDLFALAKQGSAEPRNYNADGLNLDSTEYLEIASGYSYRINKMVTVGGRLKLLVGVADAALNFDKLQASANGEINVNANGTLDIHGVGLTFPTDEQGYMQFDVDGDEKIKPAGYGAALDLGVQIRFPKVSGLTLDASISDLGGIAWNNGNIGKAGINGSVGEDITDFSVDELFKQDQTGVNEFKGLSPSLNLGVHYKVLKMLTVGAIATTRTGRYSNYEARFGASFNPGKAFSLAGSVGANSFGTCFGAAMSLKIPGFNFYVGTDSIVTEFTPEKIPVRQLNTRVNLGLVIAF